MTGRQRNRLQFAARARGAVPLYWVLGVDTPNLGDALSPLMVAMVSGSSLRLASPISRKTRLAAVGTIAQSIQGGEAWIWGTGTSRYANPQSPPDARRPFVASKAARFRVAATRGPVTRAILGEENAVGPAVYGDPVWLLPRFYPGPAEKRWELGVIVHISELTHRSPEAVTREAFLRYRIPESLRGVVRVINTWTEPTIDGLKSRLDEILACKRIVSTSLHGMVFAESYGIPCLHFPGSGGPNGLVEFSLDDEEALNLRFVDLYRGLGRKTLTAYVQSKKHETDWDHLIASIDAVWEPVEFDVDPLVESFPLDVSPLEAPPGGTIFDHPSIRSLPVTYRDLPAGWFAQHGGRLAQWVSQRARDKARSR